MDYRTPFSFVTRDKDWIGKVAIGSLLVFTGIGTIPALGWMLDIMRRVSRGDAQVLPDWSNFGQYVVDGLKLIAHAFIWALPIILVVGCAVGAAAALSDQSSDETAAGLVGVCGGLLGIAYGLAIAFLLPSAYGVLADTGSLGQALNPANALALLRANPGDHVVAVLLSGLTASALGVLGTLLCLVGVLPATVFAYAIQGHLWGQAYRRSKPVIAQALPAEGTSM